MSLEVLGISVLWLFLLGYVILGSIDFGAGFYNAYCILTGKEETLSAIIQRYLSPVWEVTNVFFVFFFVGIVGFFPQSAFYFGTILLVPASLALILMAIRGSYYAFEAYGVRGHKGYAFMYGVAGLLIPAALSIVFAIAQGGYVAIVNSQPVLDYAGLFTSPRAWSIVVLALAAVLYISAVFLTWYASQANDEGATELMRKYALTWSVPLIIAAAGIMIELRFRHIILFNQLMDLWWLFAISLVLWGVTVWFIWQRKHYKAAVWSLVGQFAFAFFAYGIAHYPYLLYPYLTIHQGFTNQAMAISLVVVFVLGLVLLIPSIYLLLKLFLFDKDYIQGNVKKE